MAYPARPILKPDGSPMIVIPDSMGSPGTQPTLREQCVLGTRKAHDAEVESKNDYRNFRRSKDISNGRVR